MSPTGCVIPLMKYQAEPQEFDIFNPIQAGGTAKTACSRLMKLSDF